MKIDSIISDDMTLEEKLAAIDEAMENLQDIEKGHTDNRTSMSAPIDPSLLMICDGCE